MPAAGFAAVSEQTSADALGTAEVVVLAGTSRPVLDAAGDPAIGWLSPVERDRAAMFRFDRDRTDYLAAHLLARICVGRLLGVPSASVRLAQRCPTCGGPHGRPAVLDHPDAHVSWAHGRGQVAAAAATAPVAVDVEATGSDRLSDVLVETALGPAEGAAVRAAERPEQAFLLQWTRRECLVKLGLASLDALRQIELTDLPLATSPPPARWRPWRDGLATMDWSDEHGGVVGAAILQTPPRIDA